MLLAGGHATDTFGRNNRPMESNRLLEDLLSLSRRQISLLEEICGLLEALRAGDGRAVPLERVAEEPRDLA